MVRMAELAARARSSRRSCCGRSTAAPTTTAVARVGIHWATEQCRDLLRQQRPRHPLLHAEPVGRDAADLREPRRQGLGRACGRGKHRPRPQPTARPSVGVRSSHSVHDASSSLLAHTALAPRMLRTAARRGARRVEGRHGRVRLAAGRGRRASAILKKGGNAVDAAVAVAFALAVTWPEAGNIGGGGFMMVCPAPGKDADRASSTARPPRPRRRPTCSPTARSTWLDHKAAGVPGTVRGLALAHAKFGKLPWKDVVAAGGRSWPRRASPSNARARDAAERRAGRPEDDERRVQARLRQAGRRRSGRPATRSCSRTSAATLRLIAEKGPDAFYTGETRRAAREGDEGRRRADHRRPTWRRTRRTSASRSTAPTAATTSTARRRRVPAASAWSRCSTSWRTST